MCTSHGAALLLLGPRHCPLPCVVHCIALLCLAVAMHARASSNLTGFVRMHDIRYIEKNDGLASLRANTFGGGSSPMTANDVYVEENKNLGRVTADAFNGLAVEGLYVDCPKTNRAAWHIPLAGTCVGASRGGCPHAFDHPHMTPAQQRLAREATTLATHCT